MKTILEFILRNEGITNTRLAAMLDVAPASITHIMSGRNKPSYDFLIKLVETFPQYDARWVLTGKGEPLSALPIKQSMDGELRLFDNISNSQSDDKTPEIVVEHDIFPDMSVSSASTPSKTRLIVCFPDHTFVAYENKQ